MLLALIVINAALWLGARQFLHRSQRKAELRAWTPFRQNPAVDAALRKAAGELADPRKRWAADRIKRTIRNFVNSEAFSISVDGVMNTRSPFWSLGRKLRNTGDNQNGSLQPVPRESCTIQ